MTEHAQRQVSRWGALVPAVVLLFLAALSLTEWWLILGYRGPDYRNTAAYAASALRLAAVFAVLAATFLFALRLRSRRALIAAYAALVGVAIAIAIAMANVRAQMTGFTLYAAAFILPFPVLALISYRLKVLPALRKTYLFWTLFSAVNTGFLAPLAFPPLLLLRPHWFGKFFWFLLPPFAISLAIVAAALVFARWRFPGLFSMPLVKTWAPYISNAVFAVIFLLAAELYKNHLIEKILETHKPDCVAVNSFFRSLGNAGEEHQFDAHALYEEGGKVFYWSYSQRNFFEGNEQLNNNFGCRPKR